MTWIVLLNIYCCVDFYFSEGKIYQDFLGQWKLCAYALHGIDPYPLIGIEKPLIDSIGIVPLKWNTTPWGLLLGNLFYPGFLPMKIARTIPRTASSITHELKLHHHLEAAEIYFAIINLIALLAVAFTFSITFKNPAIVLLSIFSVYFMIPLIVTGNADGIISCFLILSCLLWDKYPKITGLLLAFAMIKPQNALIFCFEFLLLRQFQIVFIAAVIDVVAYLLVSLMTKTNPVKLMKEFLFSGSDNEYAYYGIFTPLLPPKISMYSSMIFGVLYVGIFHCLMSECSIFRFVPVCIAATFWCYSFYNGFYVLILPIAVYVYNSSFLCAGFISVGLFLIYKFSKKYLYITRTLFEIALIIISIFSVDCA